MCARVPRRHVAARLRRHGRRRKGVPEQVAEHPQVFASLTAPSFGAVHSRPDDGRACRCGTSHEPDDAHLGGAIDPDSYDYEGAVLWNWHAPALWSRFTVELVRVLAARVGLIRGRVHALVAAHHDPAQPDRMTTRPSPADLLQPALALRVPRPSPAPTRASAPSADA